MSKLTNKLYPNLECLGSANLYIEDIVAIIDRIKLFENLSFDRLLNVLCRYINCHADGII